MRIFKTRQQLEGFIDTCADEELRSLLQQRLDELADYQLHEVGYFYIVEGANDLVTLPQLPEVREEFTNWVELVYVISDDGFGLEVFIPRGLI